MRLQAGCRDTVGCCLVQFITVQYCLCTVAHLFLDSPEMAMISRGICCRAELQDQHVDSPCAQSCLCHLAKKAASAQGRKHTFVSGERTPKW